MTSSILGLWLMYLTVATTLDIASGSTFPAPDIGVLLFLLAGSRVGRWLRGHQQPTTGC
jgi:hypothetical protein